jgi:hypothetical protein
MKKLFRNTLICLFIFLTINLQAKEINKLTAEKIAANAFAKLDNNKNIANFQVKEILTVYSDDITAFYIVNFNPSGFIILSASDATIPILGSSTESNFSLDNLPPQLDYLFDCYKTQIKDVEKQKIAPTEEIKQKWDKYSGNEATGISSNIIKSATTLPTQVSPLLTTTWGQDVGYNRCCPVVNSGGSGGHAYAGCVATAMAQILKYWGCKVNESKTHTDKYATYGTQSVDFNVADYQWSLMGNSPSDQYNAQLIRDCGVAVDMDYSPTESGAWVDIAQYAFSFYFGFKNTSVYKHDSEFVDNIAWKNALKQDLSSGRPILYSGSTSGTPSRSHSWVIDGFDSNDNFHCNWGNGSAGGYFLLTNLTPPYTTYNFNTGNVAILNLEPVMSDCSEINGNSLICTSGTSFNVPNLPTGATVTWDKSTNLTFDNQPGNPKTFSANGSGSGWIEATVHYNGDATLDRKTVLVGPQVPGTISVQMDSPINRFTASINPVPTATTYNWYLNGVLNNTYHGTEAIFNRVSPYCGRSYNVDVKAYNPCGWSTLKHLTVIEPSCLLSIVISPNPTETESTIAIYNESAAIIDLDEEWDLEVYDQLQSLKVKKIKIKGNQTKINTDNLKDGVYIVRVKIGDQVISDKLIVKH